MCIIHRELPAARKLEPESKQLSQHSHVQSGLSQCDIHIPKHLHTELGWKYGKTMGLKRIKLGKGHNIQKKWQILLR